MCIRDSPTEGAYLLAIQSDANLWEYAYNKKVVLMSPTNPVSYTHLSLFRKGLPYRPVSLW